ncbi:MAG: DUF1844 domain-containing protein [Candidatus Nanopelagicales bacterium]
MSDETPTSITAARDLAALAATEILGATIVDLMTAAAVKLGLYEGGEETRDLAEARILISAIAGLIDGAAPELGSQHAAPLRDGLRSLQLAFREYSDIPDAPGAGPGEKYTGAVSKRVSSLT